MVRDSQPAWLYTPKQALKKLSSTLPSTLSSTLPIALDNTLPAYLTIHFQVSSQDAPKYTEYVVKYTPRHDPRDAPTCTRWHTACLLDCTLPNQHSRCSQAHSPSRSQVHSQLHSISLPACLTVRSQASSQDAPKNTSKDAPWYTSESLSSTLFITLGGTLPAYLALCSQIHSPEARHSQSHLTMCSHVCSCVLGPETCWVAGARQQEVWSWWRLAGGWWWQAGGGWPASCGVRNHYGSRYHSLNIIFSVATATKSDHASPSWCWQLQPLIQQER